MDIPYVDIRDAQTTLQHRAPAFTGALDEAVGIWTRSMHLHAIVSEATRGHIINDAWYQRAGHHLVGDAGVVLKDNGSRHRKYFLIDDLYAIRLKHVDAGYRPRNYHTARADAWNTQMRFPTIPDVPRLDLCYRLDLTGTLIEDAILQYSQGDETIWRWQVCGQPVTEFAAVPSDLMGRDAFVYDDYSGVTL